MKTNVNQLVKQAIQGKVRHPIIRLPGYRVCADGIPRIVPGTGTITYNFKIGDCCMGMLGDHVEPGVSTKNSDEMEDGAYNIFACVGNEAKIISGEAKGAVGFVTGKHGGSDHVMCYFNEEVLEKLTLDDKILIKAFGTGLKLADYPSITCMNLDPALFEKMNIIEQEHYIEVGVTHIIPAKIMGSGLGQSSTYSGDYDIMTRDEKAYEAYNLNTLRYGDLVFISDHHSAFGPDYQEAAGTVGIIIHGDSYMSGHGPGMTVLLTAKGNVIRPFIDKDANLANYFREKL